MRLGPFAFLPFFLGDWATSSAMASSSASERMATGEAVMNYA